MPALMATTRLKAWLTPTKPGDGQFFLELWPASSRLPAFRWHAGLTRVLARHPHFAAHYDCYVDEMREVFGAARGQSGAHFIESVRGELLIDTARWMALEKREAMRFINLELDAWAAITRAHDFRLPAGEKPRTLKSLSYLLGWRAAEFMHGAGRYG